MSYFYGYLNGNRGVATRCGSPQSGIKAHIRSWQNDVICKLKRGEDGNDLLVIECDNLDLKVWIGNRETTIEELKNPKSRLECIKELVLLQAETE